MLPPLRWYRCVFRFEVRPKSPDRYLSQERRTLKVIARSPNFVDVGATVPELKHSAGDRNVLARELSLRSMCPPRCGVRRRLQVESDKPSSAIGFVKRGRESISPKPRLTRALRGIEVVSASTIKSAPRRHAVHSAVAGERLHETHIGVPALKLRVMWNSKASIAPRGIQRLIESLMTDEPMQRCNKLLRPA